MTENEALAWQARASMNELLAFLLSYPNEELVEVIQSGEWIEAAEEICSVLRIDLPQEFDSEAQNADKTPPALDNQSTDELPSSTEESLLHGLRAEATRLFVGAPDPVVSPYEGIWRAKEDGVQPLLFVNPHSMAVERFVKACGLGRSNGENVPFDHISTELELLEYLASIECDLVSMDNLETQELPGGSAAAAYHLFLEEHILQWVDCFCADLKAASRVPFYRAVAILLQSYIDNERSA